MYALQVVPVKFYLTNGYVKKTATEGRVNQVVVKMMDENDLSSAASRKGVVSQAWTRISQVTGPTEP